MERFKPSVGMLVVIVGIAIMTVLVINGKNTTTVTNSVATTTVEVLPEWAQDEEARAAAEAVVERKALEAELNALESNFEALTATYEANKAEYQAEKERIEKELGTYWTVKANIKAEIRKTFPEDPWTAVEVARLESEFVMQQSKHVYTASNAPPGYKPGDREQSFCIFQIHAPAHDATAKRLGFGDYRTNVESCIKMARVIYDDRGGFDPWTVYKQILAMR